MYKPVIMTKNIFFKGIILAISMCSVSVMGLEYAECVGQIVFDFFKDEERKGNKRESIMLFWLIGGIFLFLCPSKHRERVSQILAFLDLRTDAKSFSSFIE